MEGLLFNLAVSVREEEWDPDMNKGQIQTWVPKNQQLSYVLSMCNFMQMSSDTDSITNKTTVLGGGSPSAVPLVVSALSCCSFA